MPYFVFTPRANDELNADALLQYISKDDRIEIVVEVNVHHCGIDELNSIIDRFLSPLVTEDISYTVVGYNENMIHIQVNALCIRTQYDELFHFSRG